jgi:hypothetical protein
MLSDFFAEVDQVESFVLLKSILSRTAGSRRRDGKIEDKCF